MQVRQLLESRRLRHENVVLRQTTAEQGFAGIIGRSPIMLDVFRLVETVCRTNSTVLISGESGTGKELVARAMHTLSLRRDRPFVAVNCGAMPEALLESELFGHVRGAFTGADKDKKGLIEAADGGTVFLDEIGEMAPTMQVKLLRVLQERKYRRVGGTEEASSNIRVIAATNRDLPEARRRRQVPRGSVLSPQRHSGEDAGAARSRRRHPADCGALSREVHARDEQVGRGLFAGGAGGVARLSVAGQRPRAREHGRAGGGARIGTPGRGRDVAGARARRPSGHVAVRARRRRSSRPAMASVSNATCRTSNARISSARSNAPAACRRARPTRSASASGSSAT